MKILLDGADPRSYLWRHHEDLVAWLAANGIDRDTTKAVLVDDEAKTIVVTTYKTNADGRRYIDPDDPEQRRPAIEATTRTLVADLPHWIREIAVRFTRQPVSDTEGATGE